MTMRLMIGPETFTLDGEQHRKAVRDADPLQVENAAYHEAGHFVAAKAKGLPVLRAHLRWTLKDGRTVPGGGETVFGEAGPRPVEVLLAGVVGAELAGKQGTIGWGRAAGDLSKAATVLGCDEIASWREAIQETRALLRTHWREVETVASALIEDGSYGS